MVGGEGAGPHIAAFVINGRIVVIDDPPCGRVQTERWLEKLEEMEWKARNLIRGAVAGVTLSVLYVWYEAVYCLPKLQYNKLHPFTSWIPIT